MMTLFRAPSRLPPLRRSIPHGGPASTRPEIPARQDPSDTELRLTHELSQLLARRPVKRPRSHPMRFYADIEPPDPPVRMLPTGPQEDQPEGCGWPIIDDQNDSNDRTRLQSYNTNWLAAAGRLRRNHNLRLVTSWSITIVVGSFIVSVAAIILFGPPGGKFAFRKQLEVAAGQNTQTQNNMQTTPSPAGPAGVRWQLD